MSLSCAATTQTPSHLPLFGAAVGCFRPKFPKLSIPKRRAFCLHVAQRRGTRAFASGRNKLSSFQRRRGTWEDPDDGGESESDEEVEENDCEGEDISSSGVESSQVDETQDNLLQEVEQLLEPEEREILKRHATPHLEKISTAKWNLVHTLGLSGQISYMDKLLEQGVDIDALDKDGLTALHTAIIGNKTAVITHLLRKGASPHVKDRDGATLLHYAVHVGVMQYVKLLLKYNVDVNVADNEGWTPLHVATQTRSRDIVKVLLLNGADESRRNKDGNTPLDLSLCYGKDFKSYDLATVLKVVPANRKF